MIIKKRFVYLDVPEIINTKNTLKTKEEKEEKEFEKIIQKAQEKANEIILSAQQEAMKIIKDAEKKSNEILNNARNTADEIIASKENEKETFIKQLKTQIDNITKEYENKLNENIETIIKSLKEIIELVIFKFLETQIDSSVTERKLRKILDHIIAMNKVKIFLNPEDIKILPEDLLSSIKDKGIEIIESTQVDNGVIVETESGIINTSLSFQKKLLQEMIEEVLKNE
ncbi:flagellar export/assembly protein [Thermosipho ferrireducens]|uniref:Flagellar export/assembly protein n=1 Tax=Thermosipho ferrireducens TaxID=2571116 RepID=A0ABX7S492_9BACT|nr:FliH/SctL family protein [Thermosipho ferrireducens]QTA37241.1 flagellar export/assembly protein [Thermosipho ferrireducens]